MTINHEQLTFLQSINPLLAVKIRKEEEEHQREGRVYKLFYQKTYTGGSTDSYDSSVKAKTHEEAIKFAQEKLTLKDALATHSTDITDALLISSDGEELLIPHFSRKLREVEERERKQHRLRDEVQMYIEIIGNKNYGLRMVDRSFNRDCYDFKCDGKFTNIKLGDESVAVSCTNQPFHQDNKEKSKFSYRNGWNLEENVAIALHELRGSKEDQMKRLKEWIKGIWHESEDSEQKFEEWLTDLRVKDKIN